MFPPFILAIALITLCCLIFVKPEPLEIDNADYNMPKGKVTIYLLLFALAIAIVFRAIPYVIGLIVIIPALLILDRRALLNVDYGLLLTFVFFFIFSGNLARIDLVREFFSSLLEKNTLIVSALSCQFISNVPSAILLSQFTDNYKALLYGVNIGGTGTLIASLASLITFREYSENEPDKIRSYILKFSAFNFAFLIILGIFCQILLII
jgi:Na+/H+ antiporter NhaD/arsenite permease-like protein